VTHHPPFHGLTFPRTEPLRGDDLLWDAFSGNASLEALLGRHAGRIPFAFCGHTHRAREATWQGVRSYNIGGDYHFKRLLWLDLASGSIQAHTFGDPEP
jgi:hypothetical protein